MLVQVIVEKNERSDIPDIDKKKWVELLPAPTGAPASELPLIH